jgi:hypothetical protein
LEDDKKLLAVVMKAVGNKNIKLIFIANFHGGLRRGLFCSTILWDFSYLAKVY